VKSNVPITIVREDMLRFPFPDRNSCMIRLRSKFLRILATVYSIFVDFVPVWKRNFSRIGFG
jgi:hypothetical protein